MQTQADMGIDPVSCENCSVFKKGEGGPEAPGALRLRNKKATASVASSYSQNPPVVTPVWAPCKLFNIPYVTKIYGHFRQKIAISSQDNYVIKPVRFLV